MPRLKIACAQIECLPGDMEGNLARHLGAIKSARDENVDLVVFSELSLTDYISVPDMARLARGWDSVEISAIAEAAGPTVVSFGFIERGSRGEFYNSNALVSSGKVLGIHRKLNLPTYGNLQEGLHYTRGGTLDLVALDDHWNAATLICADSWNPALTWLAALKQPSLLIQPIASARAAVGGDFDNPGSWEINLRHTAMTYGLPIAMVNHCGQRGGLDFWGGSRIIDAFGRELARAGETEGLIFATIDSNDTAAARALLPTIRDADPLLIQAELSRFLTAG